jgi:hypothetical protein
MERKGNPGQKESGSKMDRRSFFHATAVIALSSVLAACQNDKGIVGEVANAMDNTPTISGPKPIASPTARPTERPTPSAQPTPTSSLEKGANASKMSTPFEGLYWPDPSKGPYGTTNLFNQKNGGYQLLVQSGARGSDIFQPQMQLLKKGTDNPYRGSCVSDEYLWRVWNMQNKGGKMSSVGDRGKTITFVEACHYKEVDSKGNVLHGITYGPGFQTLSIRNNKLWISEVYGFDPFNPDLEARIVKNPLTNHEFFQTAQQIADNWGYTEKFGNRYGKVLDISMEKSNANPNMLSGRLIVILEKATVALRMIPGTESAVISERSVTQLAPDQLKRGDLVDLAKRLGYENARELSVNSEFGVVEGNIGNGGEGLAFFDYQKGEWVGTQRLKEIIDVKSKNWKILPEYPDFHTGKDILGSTMVSLFSDGVDLPLDRSLIVGDRDMIVTNGVRGWEVDRNNKAVWTVFPRLIRVGSDQYLNLQNSANSNLLTEEKATSISSGFGFGKRFDIWVFRGAMQNVPSTFNGEAIRLKVSIWKDLLTGPEYKRDVEYFLTHGQASNHFLLSFGLALG